MKKPWIHGIGMVFIVAMASLALTVPAAQTKGTGTMRTVIMILILLNAALATVGRPQPSQDWPTNFRCCRGTGFDAYCCTLCCVRSDCQSHEDCR